MSSENYLTHNYPSFVKLPQIVRDTIITLFKKLSHENEINGFLEKHKHVNAFDFIEAILEYFNIDITINKNQLSRIPTYGRTVIIANHPLGALDAIALINVVKDVRKDVKIVASNFLSEFENINDVLIPIENVRGKMDRSSVEAIYDALKKEQAVIIFPSGEVSRARPNGIRDTRWQKGFLRIASRMQAPILPIYIDAKNSKGFYLLSMMNKSLATATIPHEMFKYKDKKISFNIGKSIPYESYNLPSLPMRDVVKLLRKHFYLFAKKNKSVFKTYNAIALPENRQELKHELQNAKALGETKDGKKIFLYSNEEENVVLKEIGRLREISFRQVKEGSGNKRDLDEFDYSYEHIILWDDKDLEIVGSYRIVKAKEIIDVFEVEGLYTATLFDYKDEFSKYFNEGIELGRSFVQPKYWNSRALDYLWQGIGAYMKANPNIRYMFGPVSISRSYDDNAVALLVYFYMNYFGAKNQSVVHRDSYNISDENRSKFEALFVHDDFNEDLLTLKNELQLGGYAVPTLYKQYSDLCDDDGVQFMDFGVDKEFDNCVDGFIVVDVHKLKASKRKRYFEA
ncbi:MAG: GNAT family N-acetyltransferase [Helicobacteraceae bacterium CG2_30_36_10]|nr:MAG: GNAT family N-acetyltransferase [Helicobacteraceae bacterium CG2_30_36_10]